jgi:hypothetical protein
MMEGPWLGIVIMGIMIGGLIWWGWWAMKKDRKNKD